MQNPYLALPMADILKVREAAYQHLAVSWISTTSSTLGWTTLEQRSRTVVQLDSGPFALDRKTLGRQRIAVVAARVEDKLQKFGIEDIPSLTTLPDADLLQLSEESRRLALQTSDKLSGVLVATGMPRSGVDEYDSGPELDGKALMTHSAKLIVASFKAPSPELSVSLN